MSPGLVWDQVGERLFETGVDHGVLYTPDDTGAYKGGVAWNGLTTVTESPSGAAANPQYADNIKYLNLIAAEEFGGTIDAFTYPPEWAQFDGISNPSPGVSVGQQGRKVFGLSFRSLVGNDIDGTEHGYKLHLLYGCQAAPSDRAYATINDQPAAIAFSWTITTTPVPVTGYKPTSLIVIESELVDATALASLEDKLYGGGSETEATLPSPDEVLQLFPKMATGATAGTPGAWTPNGSTPPADAADANTKAVVASPATAWTTGEYVQGSTSGAAGEMHWTGSTWATGQAP